MFLATTSQVAKHSSKTDCWVVVSGQVLDVTSFLGDHPGGELAILTFAGKDATEEFNMPLDLRVGSGSSGGCWVGSRQVLFC